jgi:hypothetical protein
MFRIRLGIRLCIQGAQNCPPKKENKLETTFLNSLSSRPLQWFKKTYMTFLDQKDIQIVHFYKSLSGSGYLAESGSEWFYSLRKPKNNSCSCLFWFWCGRRTYYDINLGLLVGKIIPNCLRKNACFNHENPPILYRKSSSLQRKNGEILQEAFQTH